MTLANWLTLLRVLLIAPFVAAFWLDAPAGPWLAFAFFVVAALTDLFDGLIARARNELSDFGRMLDPIADKLLVAAALVLLAAFDRASPIAVILILAREILISGLREWLAGRGVGLPVSKSAKWKTASQMMAIVLLLLAPALPPPAQAVGEGLLWLAAALTWLTALDYLRTARQALRPASGGQRAP
jgi:cardiolipin synthase